MANHKRKRPKHQRAGCLCCKPHKDERVAQRPSAGAVDLHLEVPVVRGKRRKGRKRWCRGVVGVEHAPRWVDARARSGYLEYRCEKCEKILDFVGPWSWARGKARYFTILKECGFQREYVNRWTGRLAV